MIINLLAIFPEKIYTLSQFQNTPFWPISVLVGNFNPRNTLSMPAVEISDPP